MKISELYRALSERIPKELSCEWDNDGAMCIPDGDREVRRVLVTLDVTAAAVERGREGGFDLILSHHPVIFKGLKRLCEDDPTGRKAMTLIRESISVFSFHTRLDAVEGGVNDTLAARLGLSAVTPFGEGGMGRVGELPREMSPRELAEYVKTCLNAPRVLLSDGGRSIRRVAILGGEGGDFLGDAAAEGVDAFVSGRIGYHPMTDGAGEGMTLIEAGHFYTEYPVCETLCKLLRDVDPTVLCEIFLSNTIETV